METLIAMSIFLTEMFTLIVLGAIVILACIPLYEWLKKANKPEKKQEYDWIVIFDEMFERSRKDEQRKA